MTLGQPSNLQSALSLPADVYERLKNCPVSLRRRAAPGRAPRGSVILIAPVVGLYPPLDASLAHLQTLFERAPSGDAETGAPSGLRVLAQIDRTYILATDGSALVLVDQHAAHERLVLERMRRRNP